MRIRHIILLVFIFFNINIYAQNIKNTDTEKLERAIEYFQGEKFHEALLLLQELNNHYALNPRFKAYMGVCFYYDQDYKNACKYLEEVINKINILAPHEQSVYYYCLAESYFMQEKYSEAIPYFERATILCFDNEKAEILYKLAMCYMSNSNYDIAYEYFQSSLCYYEHYGNSQEVKQRITQINNLMQECKTKP